MSEIQVKNKYERPEKVRERKSKEAEELRNKIIAPPQFHSPSSQDARGGRRASSGSGRDVLQRASVDDEFALEHGEEMNGLFLGMRGREGKGMQEVEKKRVSEGQTEHQSSTRCSPAARHESAWCLCTRRPSSSRAWRQRPSRKQSSCGLRGGRERGRGSE